MLEQFFPFIFLVGVATALIAFFALVVVAFRVKFWWGLAVLAFPPLVVVFACKHYRPSWFPSSLLALGLAMAAFPPLYTKFMPVDLGPREQVVNNVLDQGIETICEDPQRLAMIDFVSRRVLTHGFPYYSICKRIAVDTVTIHAVFHGSQD